MPDYTVKRFDELPARAGGGMLLARAGLGASAFGLQVIQMPPNSGDRYPNHDHERDGQEEVYVVLSGGGEIVIDGSERVALEPDMAVRVGPACKRQLFAGGDGLRVLAVGGVPGGVYSPPPFTDPDG